MSSAAKYVAFNLNVPRSAAIAAPAAMPGDRKGDLARGRFADGVDVSDDLRLDI